MPGHQRRPGWALAAGLVLVGLVLASCAALRGAAPGLVLGVGAVDQRNLAEPRGIDWQTRQIAARGLGEQRQAFVDRWQRSLAALKALPRFSLAASSAWPTAVSNWKAGTTPGVAVTTLNAAATKVNNAMAAGMYWDTGATRRHVFALSNNGHLMRIPSDMALNTTNVTSCFLNKTFNFTAVVLSPACTRAYCLATDGTLFVVNTADMSTVHSVALGSGSPSAHYLAPALDPALSQHDDQRDVLYVPLNDGTVYKVVCGADGIPAVQGAAHNVATTATARTGCTGCSTYSGYKLAAYGVAYNGHYYVGDTEGVFHDYTIDSDTDVKYPVSTVAGIAAAPALELQTGSSGALAMSHSASTITLTDGEARHAFVNVTRGSGPCCAWIDLARRTVSFSRPLFLDENDPANAAFGFAENHAYNVAASSTVTIDLKSTSPQGKAVTVATSATGDLGGGAQWLGNNLEPAANVAGGGGTTAYFRADASGVASDVVVEDAEVVVTAAANRNVTTPVVRRVGGYDASGSTGYYQRGTSTTWDAGSNTLSAATGPTLFDGATVNWQRVFSASTATHTVTTSFATNTEYTWRVQDVLLGPVQMDHLAFALYDPGSLTFGGAASFDPTATTALRLETETWAARPSYPVETAPILDAANLRCYAFVANVLFSLKYDDQTAWMGAGSNQHTGYQAGLLARTVAGDAGPRDGSGTFYRSTVTPVPAFNFKYMHVVSATGSGSAWNMAVSRLQPFNLQNGGTRAKPNQDLGDADRDISVGAGNEVATTRADTFSAGTATFPSNEAARYMVISPYDNLQTKGGDLYMALSDGGAGVPRLFRFGTD
ncbi:MAG: hypothetical protein VKS61_03465 [Candidatus Sericytochromatia bacterium]|nr:hypothetical protein [Candidatus Sericytochromatia bacterium]